ncbi:MAG: SIMPL domain-containing protein [Lewinellaceae bacterium]|nr:SIMPL domain-containing protein [Lewinellaceae bacterium]
MLTIWVSDRSIAQVSGNVNYQNKSQYPDQVSIAEFSGNSDIIISIKGLANIKADTYVAMFSVTQVGKTAAEANELINTRLNDVQMSMANKPGVETYVDMVSFVPVYEFEMEKKVFSKKTYNEIPAGFELKKNLHVKFNDPLFLNELITTCTNAEIYDLIRVDYFSSLMEQTKTELMQKARKMLFEKMTNYQEILNTELAAYEKQIADDYRVVYPVEMYKSYQAYSSSSLSQRKFTNSNQTDKSVTVYYQPVNDKAFDFIINPIIVEPVIQVMYELKLKINREKEARSNKEYMIITPNGDLKPITFHN